jgi:hypothetical protein
VCRDVPKALANTRTIMQPGSALVVEVANFAAKGFQIYGAAWPWADIPRHLTLFTETSLRRTLEAAGFAIDAVQYVGYPRQFSPWWIAAQTAARCANGNRNPARSPSWLWLRRTAGAPASRKYDSVRVYARPLA